VSSVVNINDVLDGHVGLDVTCVDRLSLNAYVPNLQVGGQVHQFCRHRDQPIASPAVIEKIGNRFRRDVDAYAKAHGVPLLHLAKPDRSRWDDRKLDHVRPYLDRAETAGRFGVVAIVAAQEFQWVFSATKKTNGTAVWFDWHKTERRVSCYYFYVNDREFGPGFIKICSWFPYPAKVWVNGHEWAKRQARRARVPFSDLANGFATCPRPQRLQAVCDRLGPGDIGGFFDRWIGRIPTPFTDADRNVGYWWELSMRQVEVSRTLVSDDPRRARSFFEALVADNIGIGRPHEVAAVFARQIRHARDHPFRTRVFGPGTDVKVEFAYKHSRVKQYLKEGRALRIETVINTPADVGRAVAAEALRAARSHGNPVWIAFALIGTGRAFALTLAELAAFFDRNAQHETSAALYGISTHIVVADASWMVNLAAVVDHLQAVLGDEMFDQCVATGAAMAIGDAVAYARHETQMARRRHADGCSLNPVHGRHGEAMGDGDIPVQGECRSPRGSSECCPRSDTPNGPPGAFP
jgi:hypothetical protein